MDKETSVIEGRLKRIKGFWSSSSDYYIMKGENLSIVKRRGEELFF
jgi:hypothetical protein